LIGDVIVEQGFAPRDAVEAAAVAGREEGKQLGQVLVERGHLTPEQLGQAVALRFGLEYVDILNHQVDAVAVSIVDGPSPRRLQVRFRVDGVMLDAAQVPKRMVSSVISRIKILANLDIAERRLPQDGRIGLTIDGRHIDLRVVVLPLVDAESVVLRILDSGSAPLTLEDIGMLAPDRERVSTSLRRSYGGVL